MRPILALLLVLLAVPVTAGDAARSHIPGRIVFASERGSTFENSDVYAIGANGSRRRALVVNPEGGDGGARWSPDGRLLAFWSERSEQGRVVRGLYVVRAGGGGLRRLTPRDLEVPRDWDPPSWSPDSRSLVFSGDRGPRRGIWTIRTDGTHLRFLARNGFTPEWSPKGGQIAFASGRILVVPARGGPVRRLTRGPNDSTPAWSPDGRTIAFVRSDANGLSESLQIVPASGGPLRPIFGRKGTTMGRDPQWAPDGSRIAIEANDGVYVVRLRGRAVSRLRRRGDWPAWSPDGSRIAFTVGAGVYVMNADGSRGRRVRFERGFEFSEGPVWSPDGDTLVYSLALIQSDFDIFTVRANGSGLRQLTRSPRQDWMPAWSPLKGRIAFVRRRAIWVMAADGSRQRRLFRGTQPSWSPDGAYLAYTDGGVTVRPLRGGPVSHLADGYSPAWSPSGTEIAFVRGVRLMAFNLRTGTERTIVDAASSCLGGEETSLDGPDWSPDASRLVYAVVCDDGRFASASAEVVTSDGSGRRVLPIGGLDTTRLAWSPDGSRIVFVAQSERVRVGTVGADGTGETAVVRDAGGAAYLDPDW